MQKISYTERITNKDVLDRVGLRKNLMNTIRKRQAKFFGHSMRRQKMEQLVTTGKNRWKEKSGKAEREDARWPSYLDEQGQPQ